MLFRSKDFLENGNGIYIGYQAKIGEKESYGFLPKPYDLSAEIRSRTDESTSDGELVVTDVATKHPLTTFPLQIDIKSITEQCLNNNLVTGIYWAHIKPKEEGVYNSILLDVNYQPARNILITSRSDLHPRIVASTLVVEWQCHESLWENIITDSCIIM